MWSQSQPFCSLHGKRQAGGGAGGAGVGGGAGVYNGSVHEGTGAMVAGDSASRVDRFREPEGLAEITIGRVHTRRAHVQHRSS